MLNVLTPKGKQAEAMARQAVLKLQATGQTFAWFPDHNHFAVDGYVIKDHIISAVFETKVREAKYGGGQMTFNGKAYPDLLISASKIDNGVSLATKMGINFYVIIYFSLSDICVSFRIYDATTHAVIPHGRRTSRTQAGVNGGSAVRENAYLNFSYAKEGFVL